ncbi:MAG: exonuclease RNase T and DNA polymerase III [Microgenomates group bacterium Gr01-1014_16]|nr:MAG: exonuclease RNase T and DNA polymerase III [Microgenomates group bacterium Gr01-1014_16]
MPYLLDKSPIKFRSRPILFIDLEMSGLDISRHEILEIAALLVSQPNFEVTNSYYAKIRPEHINTADPKALKKNSYDLKTWSDAIPLRQALLDLSRMAPDCLLAGWAVQNEWDFLNAALARENLPYFYHHHLIEVSTLAFVKLYPEKDVNFLNLNRVSKKLGVYLDHHKPDSDIRATYEIFKKLSGL